jgi:Prolipoprotein diacylglyceryl transferase
MDLHAPRVLLGPLSIETWTLLGRLPVALLLAALAVAMARQAGWRRAALATSGMAAGLAVGVAVVPSVLGALAGALLLCGLTIRWLGARPPGPLQVASALLAVVAVGRLGCLVNGCCFGVPTVLPWGVTFPAGTRVADLHLHAGLVGAGSPSLSIHPLPLYESLGLLLLLAALPWLRRRLRSDGAAALAAAGGYLALRAGLDGWRAMLNTRWSLVPVGPLSAFQVAALTAAAACLVGATALAWRARHVAAAHPAITPSAGPEPGPLRLALVWGAQALAVDLVLPRLTGFLAALAFFTLAGSAALLLRPLLLARDGARDGAGSLAPRRLAAALLALLLVPAGLRAADGREPAGRHWIYADARLASSEPAAGQPADPDAERARLVRIGDQDTSEETLAARAASLTPLERRTVLLTLGGGSFTYDDGSSCGGPTTFYDRKNFAGGLAYEQRTQRRDEDGQAVAQQTWQVRATVKSDTWTDRSDLQAVGVTHGSGVRATAGGLYQWEVPWGSVALGGLVGVDGSRDPLDPWFTTARRVLYPGASIRLGGRLVGLELGTLALHQPTEQPFVDLYLGGPQVFGGPETRFRVGYSPAFSGEVGHTMALTFDLSHQLERSRLQLHVATGNGAEATLRLGVDLP